MPSNDSMAQICAMQIFQSELQGQDFRIESIENKSKDIKNHEGDGEEK